MIICVKIYYFFEVILICLNGKKELKFFFQKVILSSDFLYCLMRIDSKFTIILTPFPPFVPWI